MVIRKLTREEIIHVYKDNMSLDFPQAEIKPLEIILNMEEKKKYIAFGLFEQKDLKGYAFLVRAKDERWMLLDYFAICKQYRSMGYGCLFLNMLFEEIGKTQIKAVIIEIEKIEYGIDEEEISLRTRRKEFYLKNKVISTDCFATIFDTEFEILYYSINEMYDPKKIIEEYTNIYRMMLPPKLYLQNCFI